MLDKKSQQLTILDQVSQMLAQAESLDNIKSIRDRAEAARALAKAAQLGLELQNRAAEIKLRVERKAGAFLAGLDLRGGDRRSNGHPAPLQLSDLGISQHQSKRWQLVASVPERDFARFIRAKDDLGEEITAASVHRLARELRQAKKRQAARPRTNSERSPIFEIDASQKMRDLFDLLDELDNHRQLLANLLQPFYDGDGIDLAFERCERRVVAHLLAEMETTHVQLRRALISEYPYRG